MVLLKVLLLFAFVSQILSTPFLYSAPQALSRFVSSASASTSTSVSNIANLRRTKAAKLQDSLEDDDFFKDSAINQQSNEDQDKGGDEMPNFVQRTFNKIVEVSKLLQSLLNSSPSKDEIKNEQDDFDREFNEDFSQENLEKNVGYVYNKPVKTDRSAQVRDNKMGFNPANIGVYFIELLGSLVGIIYGAAAQLNYPGSTTTVPTI